MDLLNNNKLTVRILLIVIVLIVIILGFSSYLSHQYGNVILQLQLPNTNSVSATINGKSFTFNGLQSTYKMHVGKKDIIVKDTGYATYNSSFTVKHGENLVVVSMKSSAPQNASINTATITRELSGTAPSGFYIRSSKYFYDYTWAVAVISNQQQNNAVMILNYLGNTKGWRIIQGPGTLFAKSTLNSMPANVVNYMIAQNYVDESD